MLPDKLERNETVIIAGSSSFIVGGNGSVQADLELAAEIARRYNAYEVMKKFVERAASLDWTMLDLESEAQTILNELT